MVSSLEREYEYEQARSGLGWLDAVPHDQCYRRGFDWGYAAKPRLPSLEPLPAGHEEHYWAGWEAGRIRWMLRTSPEHRGSRAVLVSILLNADDLTADPLKLALRILANYGEVLTSFQ